MFDYGLFRFGTAINVTFHTAGKIEIERNGKIWQDTQIAHETKNQSLNFVEESGDGHLLMVIRR